MKTKEGRLLARDFGLGDADLQRAAEILRAGAGWVETEAAMKSSLRQAIVR